MNNSVPTFETKRLLLKPVTLADADAYQKHFADYEVIRHLSAQIPWPYPDDGVKDFIENCILPIQGKNKWVWGLHLKSNPNELIGAVDLWREGTPEHRGFWLGRQFWRQGLMTEAVHPVMDYAFDDLGFEKLIFSNAVGNLGSHRVKEKTGATLVKIITRNFVDPQYSDCEVWELTKQNWSAFKVKH